MARCRQGLDLAQGTVLSLIFRVPGLPYRKPPVSVAGWCSMRINLEWLGGVGFSASTRHFKGITIDEPPEFHGGDRGPSSVEYIGIAIGGCLGTSFAYCLQKMEVAARKIDISIDVEMHHAGNEEKNPLRITGIDAAINVELEDPADAEILDLCIESFKRYCVVTQSVMSGVPVNVSVSKSH